MAQLPIWIGKCDPGLSCKVMYGYRPAEVGVSLGPNESPDESFKVTRIRPGFHNMDKRVPVRMSLGCHVENHSLPVPDLNHGPSLLAGCTKRVAAKMPEISKPVLRKFKRFVKRFFKKHLSSLRFEPSESFDFEEWIESVDYPRFRKDELRRVYENGLDKRPNAKVKAFAKNENYTVPKHLRGIYSRHDDYKVRVGPFFKKFGDRLFALPWFIKKFAVPDRPRLLLEKLERFRTIFCTDFSQFEATFVRELMLIENNVYRMCLEGHPDQKKLCDLFHLTAVINDISFKDFDIRLEAKRMSGEMSTSCGNGLMNMLITFFLLENSGNKWGDFDAYFEGDDGIVGCVHAPAASDYKSLGAHIKLEVPPDIASASFCGNVFAPAAMHNVTNPLEASVAFGWTNYSYYGSGPKVLNSLLCCKALSMAYEYPGCPILRSLSRYALRMTWSLFKNPQDLFSEFVRLESNQYEVELLRKAIDYVSESGVPDVQIHDETRLLVERLYGVPVPMQLSIESYLDNLNELVPLDFSCLEFPKEWYSNDLVYTCYVEPRSKLPPIPFNLQGFSTVCYLAPGHLVSYRH